MQLDATLGTLIEKLDETVGRERYILALTSDHGVAEIPAQEDSGQIFDEDLQQLLERILVSQWGARPEGPYVDNVTMGNVYFAPGIFDRLRAAPKALEGVERALLATRGVARVLHGDRLSETTTDPMVRAAALGYVPGRSGDMIIVTRQNWFIGLKTNDYATSHGTMYEYDREVPIVLLGGAFKPGRFVQRVTPADIAPTLASVARVTMSKAEGSVLSVALK